MAKHVSLKHLPLKRLLLLMILCSNACCSVDTGISSVKKGLARKQIIDDSRKIRIFLIPRSNRSVGRINQAAEKSICAIAAINKIPRLGNARGLTATEPVLSLIKIETMRTPQRNFVVEYKSGRRRLGKLPNAIWGNTDFKALVDEAEADAPHLFGPKASSEAPGRDCEVNAIPEMKVAPLNTNDALVPAPPTEIDEISEVALDPVSSDAKPPAARLQREPKQRRKPSPKLRIDNGINLLTSVSEAQPEAPFDELASLEEENSLLRLMLVKSLTDENNQLRGMLERSAARAIL